MWMLLGFVVGLVYTALHKRRGAGVYAATLSLGCIGALFGGIAGAAAGINSMSDFTWLSLAPAGAGAALLIGIYLIANRERRY